MRFSPETAPQRLGRPHSSVLHCDQLLPDFWRVVFQDDGVVRWIVWDDEHGHVQETGLPALQAYLKRHEPSITPDAKYAFAELLAALHALPDGFRAEALHSAVDPSTGTTGSIAVDPLTVTLIAVGFTPGSSPAGYSEPSIGRAILKRVDGELAWTVEWRVQPGQPWQHVSGPVPSFDGSFEGRWERHWTEQLAPPPIGGEPPPAPARHRLWDLRDGRYAIYDAPRREEHGRYVVEERDGPRARLRLTAEDAKRDYRIELRMLDERTLEIDGQPFTRAE